MLNSHAVPSESSAGVDCVLGRKAIRERSVLIRNERPHIAGTRLASNLLLIVMTLVTARFNTVFVFRNRDHGHNAAEPGRNEVHREKFVMLCVCLFAYFFVVIFRSSQIVNPKQNACSSSSEMSVCTYEIRHRCNQIMLLALFLTSVYGKANGYRLGCP